MLLHKKQGFQYVRHGIWAFFTNFAADYAQQATQQLVNEV